MSGTSSPPSTRPLRLRSTVASRELQGRGVAISAGGSAVVINGAEAVTLWTAIEPHLRRGVIPDEFLSALPAAAKGTVDAILGQLHAHSLFVEVEDEEDSDLLPSLDYLQRVSRSPFAAARRVAATVIEVGGAGGELAESLRQSFEACGFRGLKFLPASSSASSVITIRGEFEQAAAEPIVVIAARAGFHAVGPLEVPLTPPLLEQVIEWSRDSPNDGTPPLLALVAGQAALAALRAIGDMVAPSPGDAGGPSFLASTSELVAEPHVFATFGTDWKRDRRVDLSTEPSPGARLDSPTLLERMLPLWDPVFGISPEPTPGALPQVPVGLADISGLPLAGVGLTAAEARVDAVLFAVAQLAGPREAATGVGPDVIGASVSALIGLLHETTERTAGTDPKHELPQTAGARWLASAATLLLDREVRLALGPLEGPWKGLFRATADLDDGLVGIAYGADPDIALEAALLRAVGRAQHPDPQSVPALDRYSALARRITDWHGLRDAVSFDRLVARGWADVGVIAVAARENPQ